MITTVSKPETGQDRVLKLPVRVVRPSVENDRLYRPIDHNDPDIIALAESIEANGIKEPLLVTRDHFIICGHRRFAAAQRAGLTSVPCRVEPFNKCDDPDRFLRLLRECNLQRVKTLDEKLREELLSTNTEEAYESLVAYREAQSAVSVDTIELRESGKERLVVLMVTDFDPDGEEIAHSFARSMRDDFGIKKIDAIKVALTADQVVAFNLPPKMKAKETSVNYVRFVVENGTDVFEVEAMETADLQKVLEGTIDSVIDTEAFNHEVSQEAQDAAFPNATRRTVHSALSEIMLDDSEAGG